MMDSFDLHSLSPIHLPNSLISRYQPPACETSIPGLHTRPTERLSRRAALITDPYQSRDYVIRRDTSELVAVTAGLPRFTLESCDIVQQSSGVREIPDRSQVSHLNHPQLLKVSSQSSAILKKLADTDCDGPVHAGHRTAYGNAILSLPRCLINPEIPDGQATAIGTEAGMAGATVIVRNFPQRSQPPSGGFVSEPGILRSTT